jgi:hypothetical protein
MAIVAAVAAINVPVAGAAAAPEYGPWLFWTPPTAQQSYTALSQRVTPRNLAPTTYWSTQWFWSGAPDGGYAGIQTDGDRADGTVGPMALFSVWDATKAIAGPHSSCIPFDGEGKGMSCRMPFTVTANDTYRTDVVNTRADQAGRWWHTTITDETTNNVADLGEIAAPVAATARMPASFVEYFGRPVGCGQEPIVTSDFQAPVVTPAGTATPLPSAYDHATERTCARALISSAGGVTTMTSGGPQPSYVPNVAASAADTVVTVRWDQAISDGGLPISDYTIQASTDAGVSWSSVASADASARVASMALATGLYQFRVAAENAAGTGAFSDPTPVLRVGTLRVALAMPTAAITLVPSIAVWWSGSGPAGVDHYSVQHRDAPWNGAFGSWSTWLGATPKTAAVFGATYGRSYCFRVQAVDRTGSVSGYSAARCTTVPMRAALFATSTGWTRVSDKTMLSGRGITTTLAGATATRTKIRGSSLALIATRCSTCGTLDVLWNGTRIASVDLRAPTTAARSVIALTSFATPQTGTLTFVATSSGSPVTIEGVAAIAT